jgi:hypothetical protein
MSAASILRFLPKIKFSNSTDIFSYFVGDPEELKKEITSEKEIYEKITEEKERANYEKEKEKEITELINTKRTIKIIGYAVALVFIIFLIVFFAASDSSVKSAFKWLSIASAIILGILIVVFARNNRNVIDKPKILNGVLGY